MKLGFIGTGVMGEAIARRIFQSGAPLLVWNRTTARSAALAAIGVDVAATALHVLEDCDCVFLMLLDEQATRSVLLPQRTRSSRWLAGKTIINLGTVSVEYSLMLARWVNAAGARYVEAPVSGSRVQAEQGRLVLMLAGDVDAMDLAESLLAPATARVFRCGPAPAALRLKLAVNHFLIVMVAGLAEAVQAARNSGLDLGLLRDVLDAGPMASEVSRIKLDKLLSGDLAPQASIHDVRTIAELVSSHATGCGTASPLIEACVGLFQRADRAGASNLDMIAVATHADSPVAPRR